MVLILNAAKCSQSDFVLTMLFSMSAAVGAKALLFSAEMELKVEPARQIY